MFKKEACHSRQSNEQTQTQRSPRSWKLCGEFKITIIKMLNILLEKVGNIHEHTENFSREKKNESNKMLGATTTMKKTRQQK